MNVLPRVTLLASFGWLLACGPSAASDDGTGDFTTDETGDSPTGGPPVSGVCLEPQVSDILPADEVIACTPPDDAWATFHLDVAGWPELDPLDETYCEGVTVEADAACTVSAITIVDEAASRVGLQCLDDAGQHAVGIEIGAAWLRFRVCEGDSVRFRYYRNNYGCGWGGYSEAMVLRDASSRLLAASFDGSRAGWLAPLSVDPIDHTGCEKDVYECSSYERSAVVVREADGPALVVPDGTRRLLDLSSRYLARASVTWVEEWDGCGEGGGGVSLDLALVEP